MGTSLQDAILHSVVRIQRHVLLFVILVSHSQCTGIPIGGKIVSLENAQ